MRGIYRQDTTIEFRRGETSSFSTQQRASSDGTAHAIEFSLLWAQLMHRNRRTGVAEEKQDNLKHANSEYKERLHYGQETSSSSQLTIL